MVGRLAGTIVGAALVFTACAETDSGRPGGAKGEVIAQGDPICVEMRQAVGRLGDEAEKDRDAVQAGVDKLKAISQPGEDVEMLQVFLVRLQNTALALEDVNQAGIQKDGPRAERALATAREQDTLAAEAAESYGFEECAVKMESS